MKSSKSWSPLDNCRLGSAPSKFLTFCTYYKSYNRLLSEKPNAQVLEHWSRVALTRINIQVHSILKLISQSRDKQINKSVSSQSRDMLDCRRYFLELVVYGLLIKNTISYFLSAELKFSYQNRFKLSNPVSQ